MTKYLVLLLLSSHINHSHGADREVFKSLATASFTSSFAATTAVTVLVAATKDASPDLAMPLSSFSCTCFPGLDFVSVLWDPKGSTFWVCD